MCRAEYEWFDLNTDFGFSLPDLKQEIVRVGLVDKSSEIIEVISGREYEPPVDQIVSALMEYDDIDYVKNSALLYHLAQQALDAIQRAAGEDSDAAEIVYNFREAIAGMIYKQLKDHFVMKPLGYTRPKVLPFSGIVEQHLTEVEGYGKRDYRDSVDKKSVPKIIFTGFTKSYYTQCKFDSMTELDFANVLESDADVKKWLRPASSQFNIYWSNGSRRYEPDFVVETESCIYLVETKAAKDVNDADVQDKKRAAEEYCKNATEYTSENGGKPWRYILLAHDVVDRTMSFRYLAALGD